MATLWAWTASLAGLSTRPTCVGSDPIQGTLCPNAPSSMPPAALAFRSSCYQMTSNSSEHWLCNPITDLKVLHQVASIWLGLKSMTLGEMHGQSHPSSRRAQIA